MVSNVATSALLLLGVLNQHFVTAEENITIHTDLLPRNDSVTSNNEFVTSSNKFVTSNNESVSSNNGENVKANEGIDIPGAFSAGVSAANFVMQVWGAVMDHATCKAVGEGFTYSSSEECKDVCVNDCNLGRCCEWENQCWRVRDWGFVAGAADRNGERKVHTLAHDLDIERWQRASANTPIMNDYSLNSIFLQWYTGDCVTALAMSCGDMVGSNEGRGVVLKKDYIWNLYKQQGLTPSHCGPGNVGVKADRGVWLVNKFGSLNFNECYRHADGWNQMWCIIGKSWTWQQGPLA